MNLTEGDGWDELSLRPKLSFYTEDTVDMWVLEAPVSVHEFHKYLDELDLRVARERAHPRTAGTQRRRSRSLH